MKWTCTNCETLNEGAFCAICGEKAPEAPAAPSTSVMQTEDDADKTVAIPTPTGPMSNPMQPPHGGAPVPPPTGYGSGMMPPPGAPYGPGGGYPGMPNTIAMMQQMEQKKKNKKIVIIVISVVVGLVVLLAIIGALGSTETADSGDGNYGSATAVASTKPSPLVQTSSKPSAKVTASSGPATATKKTNDKVAYSASLASGTAVYADIVSIEPDVGISHGIDAKNADNEEVVCKCVNTAGEKLYIYMTVVDFNRYIDPTADIKDSEKAFFDKVKLSPAKRITGVVRNSEDIVDGLEDSINSKTVLSFTAIAEIE